MLALILSTTADVLPSGGEVLTANELDLGALLQLSLLLSLLDCAIVGLFCCDLSGNLARNGLIELVQHVHRLQGTQEGTQWGAC